MATALHTYDPLQIKVIFKGVEVRGIKKGTFVKVSRSTPTWSAQVSGDGQDVTRIRARDKTGMIEITLIAGSETNRQFADIMRSDELNGDGVGVGSVRDLNGNDKPTSEQAWLVQPAEAEYAEDAGDRVWKIYCVNLDTFSGGSLSA